MKRAPRGLGMASSTSLLRARVARLPGIQQASNARRKERLALCRSAGVSPVQPLSPAPQRPGSKLRIMTTTSIQLENQCPKNPPGKAVAATGAQIRASHFKPCVKVAESSNTLNTRATTVTVKLGE
jgi:hypothetical protein